MNMTILVILRFVLLKGARGVILLLVVWMAKSCLKDIPSETPAGFVYDPAFALPVGEVEFGLKVPFGFDTTLLQTDPLTQFPYWSEIPSIPISGEVEVDFESLIGAREHVKTVLLRFNTYNGFPTEIMMQGYLKNSAGNDIDSLFDPSLVLERGTVKGGGLTDEFAYKQSEILFDEERIDLLYQTKVISFLGNVKTVEFFPEYTFRVQLGVVLGITYDIAF